MVAFIGAVICIIAAVHMSSAAAAPQPPAADNQSTSPDYGSQTPVGGPQLVGSLGALHGSVTPDFEAPTLNILTGLDGTPEASVRRLICTPIPAGECDPKNFQQQADESSVNAGEDWGYLRSTAEELKQTVLQQKNQILTDQRTIRELTGKLSECESGMEGVNSPERGAGLRRERWGHDGVVMVRDQESPSAVQLLTDREVKNLDEAISLLKDRIDRLEADISPSPHNHTAGSSQATRPPSEAPGRRGKAGQQAGLKRWRMEELEGVLQRQVQLLEQERESLRLESQQGVHASHPHLAQLEEEAPAGFTLSFPTRSSHMYAVVSHPIPELAAFTACLWLRSIQGRLGTPLSYAVQEQPNELVLLQGLHSALELLINNKVAVLPLNLTRGSWQHLCVSWSQKAGAWQAYLGGRLKGQGEGLAAGHVIRPGGVLILGQEQDTLGGGFDWSQALVGELSQVNLWERELQPAEVAQLVRCGRVTQGNVAPWRDRDLEVFGGATKSPGEPCAHTHQ